MRRIPTGKEPHHLYMTPDEKSVIVANALADSLTFIDPRTAEVQRTVRGILDPYHLRFSPDMKWFVTAGNRLQPRRHLPLGRQASLQLAKRIPTGKTPSHLWIDSKQHRGLRHACRTATSWWPSTWPRRRSRGACKTGPMPADVYGTPDDKPLLVGLTGGDSVEVYDVSGAAAASSSQRITTGDGAHAFRAAGDKRHVYVSNRVANTISKIDLQTLAGGRQLPGAGRPRLHGRAGRRQDAAGHLALGPQADA